MAKKTDFSEIKVLQKEHELITNRRFEASQFDINQSGSQSTEVDWDDSDRRIEFRDPFKQHEVLTDLSKHHQNYANKVQNPIDPDPKKNQENNLGNNFGVSSKNEFLPHPLLAGRPYFNGMDPKTTSLPSETELTDSPEFNNARNELRYQKALQKQKQLQLDQPFNPKPDGP